MEHRGDADAGAQVLGIGRDCQHGLGRGSEQQIVDHRFVLVGDIGDCRRQCEDHMEVGHGQELGLAFGEPLLCRSALTFWAVPVAAGVIGDSREGSVLAAHDMPAERRRAATLDRRHNLELAEADMAGVSLPPRRSVGAEDIRDLESGTDHASRRFRPAARASWRSAA